MTETRTETSYWPEEISALPIIEFHVAGVTGHSLKNDEKQVSFFRFEEGTVVPDHSHGAQWGYLLSGEMTLEVDGRSELFEPGDVYYIPAGKKHRTSFSRVSYVIDMGDDPERFRIAE